MLKISETKFRNYVSNIIIVVVIVCLFSLTYLGGTVRVFSSSNDKVYYHGNLNNNNISLMFNVYMGSEFIQPILQTLEKYNAQATFFVGGCWVSKKGHEIGNHGYWHKDHKTLSQNQNESEIYLTHELVKSCINKDMLLFAPPSGSYNQTTLKVATYLGYKTIMWTKDTIDWRDQDQELIYDRAIKSPCGGDLILMHPTKATMLALEKVLFFYSNKGYKLTTVSENIA